ncbi:hypothetical protein ACFV1N_46005 [Streptosporangium canum]|uniref:recombination directionality factor n=1 Tax=Streptosporangium canum TaxID=324952 RepID=UPI0036B24B40
MPVHPNALARLGIRDAQRSYWPDGHIRIGHRVPTRSGGTRPEKLDVFRLSSPSKSIIERIAEMYGGTVQEMTEGNDKWQVTTNASELEILVPPQPVTTSLELWNRGNRCERRCDGETIEEKSGRPCLCKAEGVQRCVLTTRLTVMLADVPSLGYWLLTSRGVNAFKNLPGRAEFANMAGPYVAATLYLQEGRSLVDGEAVTFMVPLLRIEGEGATPEERLTPRKVVAGLAASRPAIGAGASQALDGAPTPADYLVRAHAATSADEVMKIWEAAREAGDLTPQLRAELNAIGKALRQQEATSAAGTTQERPPTPAAPTAANETSDQIWMQIVALWPSTLNELHAAFAQRMKTSPKHATLDQLEQFRATIVRARSAHDDGRVVDAEIVADSEADDASPPSTS